MYNVGSQGTIPSAHGLVLCKLLGTRIMSTWSLALMEHSNCRSPNHSISSYVISRDGHSRIGLAMPVWSWNHLSPIRNSLLSP